MYSPFFMALRCPAQLACFCAGLAGSGMSLFLPYVLHFLQKLFNPFYPVCLFRRLRCESMKQATGHTARRRKEIRLQWQSILVPFRSLVTSLRSHCVSVVSAFLLLCIPSRIFFLLLLLHFLLPVKVFSVSAYLFINFPFT